MKKGFTLIELLVVVLIIGILSSVALPQYQKAVAKSRYATLKNLTESLYQADQVYFLANGTHATDFDELSIDAGGTPDPSDSSKRVFPWGYCALFPIQVMCYNDSIQMGYFVGTGSNPTLDDKFQPIRDEGGQYVLTDRTGIRFCRAKRGTLGDQICKQETNNNRSSAATSDPDAKLYEYR